MNDKQMQRKKPELLAPAGNLEKLKVACAYGADAIYLGGKSFGLRALGANFSPEEMEAGIRYAHALGKKIYVTVNIMPHNADVDRFPAYLDFLQTVHADAAIISDLGLFMLARKQTPHLPLHISTQANVVNYASVQAWEKLGATRVVLARELAKEEIATIRANSSVELEVFVHGAMCISYSGRCLLSSYMTGRDANRGACAQSCRWQYALVEEKRPDEAYEIREDERGTYILNAKDLCLLPYVGELGALGVDSLKIEGRMKSAHYVACTTKAYREAIDAWAEQGDAFSVQSAWERELSMASHRTYTDGFYRGAHGMGMQIYQGSSYDPGADFEGLVLDYDARTKIATVEQRNVMTADETLEILRPQGTPFQQTLQGMTDAEGNPVQRAPHPKQILHIPMKQPVMPYAILRRERLASKKDEHAKGA